MRLEQRTGPPAGRILEVAAESGADMTALACRRHLAPGRAAVARELLSRATAPVALFPVSEERTDFFIDTGASRDVLRRIQ